MFETNLKVDIVTQRQQILDYLDKNGTATYDDIHRKLWIMSPTKRCSELFRLGLINKEFTRIGRNNKRVIQISRAKEGVL